jgi:SAM-dependent methyltransferase
MAYQPPSPAQLIAVLPKAPINASPVPGLTSLYHKSWAGPYGSRAYPGNCSGELIKDLLRYFTPRNVLDPMTGSGTCADVCRELKLSCHSGDVRSGQDACDPATFAGLGTFDFVWIHPPYWRQIRYSDDPRDLSTCPTLSAFLARYKALIENCAAVLNPGGRLAVLMGNYADREAGHVDLVYETKRLAREAGLTQQVTDIIRFSHNASSSNRVYRSSFIPGLHDVCTVFERAR